MSHSLARARAFFAVFAAANRAAASAQTGHVPPAAALATLGIAPEHYRAIRR